MCMWMLQPVGVSSNHILHNSCFLALFSGPECAHWQHCLGYGLRAFGSGNCGYLECCPEVGREEWALTRQHNLAPHTLCPLGRGKSELGTLKWESPDSCPSYPSQRTKLMRKSLTHSNLGQRHTPPKKLREQTMKIYLKKECWSQQKWQVQEPWSRCMLGMLQERQRDQSDWSGTSGRAVNRKRWFHTQRPDPKESYGSL